MISMSLFLSATCLFMGVLVAGTTLYEKCESDDHCGVVDSYCNNGTCVCSEHFVSHDGACIQVFEPQMSCTINSNCQPTLGNRSICKDGSCACIPNHHVHTNMCIKNRGLNERCEDDDQCYWGRDMLDRMSCIRGECSCKKGYRPHQHRRCASGANSNYITSVATVLMVLLTGKLF